MASIEQEKLTGKLAMVTGGASGLGAAIVERLVNDGADVACCYNKSGSDADQLVERLNSKGRHVIKIKVDVTDSKQVETAVASIQRHFGRPVSILVNNAGDMIQSAYVDLMDEELWDLVMSINLKGTFLCSKYCIPGMKSIDGGCIINMSSISARSGGGHGTSHYAASKGGIEAFTRALAKELAAYNIMVNAISPGVILTPMHERNNTPEVLEKIRREYIPLQRLGDPEDVAGVVSFLCSRDALYITGEIIAINGGMRMD